MTSVSSGIMAGLTFVHDWLHVKYPSVKLCKNNRLVSYLIAGQAMATAPMPDPTTPVVNGGIYYAIGPLDLTIPWQNVNIAYLFDFESKTNLVSGKRCSESSISRYHGRRGHVR